MQWGIPKRVPCTPEEEADVQWAWVTRALELGLDYVSPMYHPHSIYQMSEDCRTMELLMRRLAAEGIATTTYTALYERYRDTPVGLPGPHAWSWEAERAQVAAGELWSATGTVDA